MVVDSSAAVQFLQIAYHQDDWIAIFLKSYETGRTAQRVGPVATFLEPRFHAWLRAMNAQRFNVYVSVNAIRPGVRARTKSSIGTVRHLFLEADEDGTGVLLRIRRSADLPQPSYVLESSPNRVHVFWRVDGFGCEAIERLQKHLAIEFDTDTAATACSQTTRVPGYLNHKRVPSHLVTVEYGESEARRAPSDFPIPPVHPPPAFGPRRVIATSVDILERARRYLARIEPAIAGQRGDLHTFRVCCRVVRGFGLDDADALVALNEWNSRCDPPWSERDLSDKIARAKRYGHEPFGGML